MKAERSTCRLCGLVILIGSGNFPDQMSQESGFCGEPCREVWEAQKEIDKQEAAR